MWVFAAALIYFYPIVPKNQTRGESEVRDGGGDAVSSLADSRLASDQIVFFGLPHCARGMQYIFISLFISEINLSPLS